MESYRWILKIPLGISVIAGMLWLCNSIISGSRPLSSPETEDLEQGRESCESCESASEPGLSDTPGSPGEVEGPVTPREERGEGIELTGGKVEGDERVGGKVGDRKMD